MAIIKDSDLLNADGSIPILLISKCLEEHQGMLKRYKKLYDYYDGEHDIKSRTFSNAQLPNNKLVCNHAEYITDMAVGYVFGAPISYSGTGAKDLNDIFTKIDEDSHNNELALDLSIFGVGYELVYMNGKDVPYPELATVSPLNGFVVVDSTVKHNPLFAVTYFQKRDIEGSVKGFDVTVYTDKEVIKYFFKDLTDKTAVETERYFHYFDGIQVIEYKNKKTLKGDFEGVISLIDAYNLLQSDRVNDKEQLIDALLAVKGASFGDTEEEMTQTAKFLKENKILELPEGGDAKWLIKNLEEAEIEVLKNSLKDDIHEFSKVPCLTDREFVGNASGVAMKYKLLGFEQLGKTKERYFKQGLRQRLKLMSNIENIRSKNVNASDVDIVMKRSLPVDDEMLARIAQETEGFISWETRVKRFDEEIDVDEERKKLEEDNNKKLEQQQKVFGSYDFKKDGEVGEEEK